MNKIVTTVLIFSFLLFLPAKVFASASPTITIVNPLRGPQLGLEKQDLVASLKSQWKYTKDASVSATWLWQYSALENNQMINLAKTEMQNQEHGIFFEIDKNTAEKSEIQYRGRNQWYHSDGLLLVSYDLYERHKIIDTTFKKFKEIFGHYPSSVGAWWVGAESINYMQEKYGITAVLQCSDQFNTDAYSIWGTPWSIPYLPRKNNAAVPAEDYDSSSKVVVMQWAARDPNRAYGDSVTHSTYSMQDYASKGYDLRYIQYLQDIFLKRAGDQLVFGLEGGIIPEGYKDYGKQVAQTKQWEQERRLQVQNMKEYADQFLKTKQVLPSTAYFVSKDYENNNQTVWYNSPYYRIGIQKKVDKVSIIDLRDYRNTPEEDFNIVPNTQKLVRINTKASIDSVRFPEQETSIDGDGENLTIEEKGINIIVFSGSRQIISLSPKEILYHGKAYEIDTVDRHTIQLMYPQQYGRLLLKAERIGNEYKGWQQRMNQSKKEFAKALLVGYILFGLLITVLVLIKTGNKKLATVIPLMLLGLAGWKFYTEIKEPENIILTSYEIGALTQIKNAHAKVIYLEPEQHLEFRAVVPYIYAKPNLAEKISGTTWEFLKRKKDTPLELKIDANSIVLVPRYLGQEIYPGEIETLKLKKIYDNAQIELYVKR